MGRRLDGCGSHGATADCDRGDRQAVGSRSMVPTVQMRPTSQSWTPEENMTSLEILDHLIRYVRLREDLHIVLALERRDAGCRQCRSAEDPRVAGDLLGAGPTARRLLRRRRAAQSPRLPLPARPGSSALRHQHPLTVQKRTGAPQLPRAPYSFAILTLSFTRPGWRHGRA